MYNNNYNYNSYSNPNNYNKPNRQPQKNELFQKIVDLQNALHEEEAMRNLFFDDRDAINKKLESNLIDYYNMKLSIQELYDNIQNSDNQNKIEYVLMEKPQTEIAQYYDHLSNLFFFIHDSNEMTLKLIEKFPPSLYPQLANYFCDYYYVNIFSSSYMNEGLLTLIYLLLEKEIDKLNFEKIDEIPNDFLGPTSFVSHILRNLSRKPEIRDFLSDILRRTLALTSGFLTNRKDNMFLGFDLKNIFSFLHSKNYPLKRTSKYTDSFTEALTNEIKKSKLNLMKNKVKEIKKKMDPKQVKIEIDKEEVQNNFYIKATNDTFDNLYLFLEENDPNDTDKGLKYMKNKKRAQNKDDFEFFFINSGYFCPNNEMEDDIDDENENDKNLYNDSYTKDLNKEGLLAALDIQDDRNMEEYILKLIEIAQDNEPKEVFTNTKLFSDLQNCGAPVDDLYKIALVLKYHFLCIKLFIDELLSSMLQNLEKVPYMIKAICTIIVKLFISRMGELSGLFQMKVIKCFLFKNLILPVLENPQYNGVLMFNFKNNKERNLKIRTVIRVLQKLLNGDLFKSNVGDEFLYTIFNPYFLEIMPFVLEFMSEIATAKLPPNIQQLLEIREREIEEETLYEKDIDFSFLKYHPEERLEHESICLPLKDISFIIDIIRANDENILGDKKSLPFKTYKKITYHLDNLAEKVKDDEVNMRKTFIIFSKLVLDDDLKKKMELKKEQKFTFATPEQQGKNNSNEASIKYCIKTIVKHLNVLSRNNGMEYRFNAADFVSGIRKIMENEGFSEIIKEKTLPLEWFDLYLKTNISNYAAIHGKNWDEKLYNELIVESKKNLFEIKNDVSLNLIYSKILNSQKIIDIGQNNLNQIINDGKKYEIFDFLMNGEINVIVNICWEKRIKVNGVIDPNIKVKKKGQPGEEVSLITRILVREAKSHRETIKGSQTMKFQTFLDFCRNFPNIEYDDLEDRNILKDAMFLYLGIVFQQMVRQPQFSEFVKANSLKVQILIENYLYSQMYDKLYKSEFQSDNDLFINMVKLSWIKPEMLDPDLKSLDPKYYMLMLDFICKMDTEMSPIIKLKAFEKICLIIDNILNLYEFKSPDIYKKILLYVFVKGKISNLFSIFNYIELYCNDYIKDQKQYLIDKKNQLIAYIYHIKDSDLKGVSKRDFDEKCKNALK